MKEEIKCWDCQRILKENEEYMPYPVNTSDNPKKIYAKCKKCHEIEPLLKNFRLTEVYSRVVGYLRPVSNWNPGKKAEMKDRKTFKLKDK